MRKKQLEGGTLRSVMAAEIKRVMAKYAHETNRVVYFASLELGITPRTLLIWLGPLEKGGWEELQVSTEKAMEKVLNTPLETKKKKKGSKGKTKSKTVYRAARA